MISFSELVKSDIQPFGDCSADDIRSNLTHLHYAVNFVRRLYDRPLVCSSGLRSWNEHKDIYEKLGRPAPTGSCHLIGGACDIVDISGYLKQFIKQNPNILEIINLYCEDFDSTPNWVHFQIYAPQSMKRFFKP